MKKIIITIVLILIFLLVGIGLLFFPSQIEGYLSDYPHTLQALIGLFTFLTTTLSIGIAYASYSKNIKQQKKIEDEKQCVFQENSDRIINTLKSELSKYTRDINVFTVKYTSQDIAFCKLEKEHNLKENLEKIGDITSKMRIEKSNELTNDDLIDISILHNAVNSALFMYDERDKAEEEHKKQFDNLIIIELNKIRNMVFYT
ncbi:putative uncharacterized protein [Staphylococcus equorum subsp. equorum Mu2]|uniref:hypothetical protein n=1 Tax=Staphylococcus equorum TaxID=246432 RepID=UPI000267DE9E|nr:hypothetical protein [Staphylococcus equorum]CCI60779.1 putative uncharacterized protein [Staphylococcus equorum subsp. equorum Mu2]